MRKDRRTRKETLRKVAAAGMALAMCMSFMGVSAFAAEDGMEDTEVDQVEVVLSEEIAEESEGTVIDIPDREIALEDVPETGDVSVLALGLSALLSGGGVIGLVGLSRKDKEKT